MQEFNGMFDGVVDPRWSNATRHDFHEMLVIALMTIISGGETCTDTALFGKSKEEFLRGFMRPGHGVPSHDTFPGLFNRIDPTQLGGLLLRFARDWSEGIGDGVVAIDGKALRRSFGSASPLHLVQGFASHSRLVLGQVRVDGRSNEITAMPALLELNGATVTADAMHTQRSTAQAVTDRVLYLVVSRGVGFGLFRPDLSLPLRAGSAVLEQGGSLRCCGYPFVVIPGSRFRCRFRRCVGSAAAPRGFCSSPFRLSAAGT